MNTILSSIKIMNSVNFYKRCSFFRTFFKNEKEINGFDAIRFFQILNTRYTNGYKVFEGKLNSSDSGFILTKIVYRQKFLSKKLNEGYVVEGVFQNNKKCKVVFWFYNYNLWYFSIVFLPSLFLVITLFFNASADRYFICCLYYLVSDLFFNLLQYLSVTYSWEDFISFETDK